eukprot:gene12707-8669_t
MQFIEIQHFFHNLWSFNLAQHTSDYYYINKGATKGLKTYFFITKTLFPSLPSLEVHLWLLSCALASVGLAPLSAFSSCVAVPLPLALALGLSSPSAPPHRWFPLLRPPGPSPPSGSFLIILVEFKYIFINILITARYFYYKNWWATIPF